jgi:hypothetical protein
MEKKIAGLLGAAAALTTITSAPGCAGAIVRTDCGNKLPRASQSDPKRRAVIESR